MMMLLSFKDEMIYQMQTMSYIPIYQGQLLTKHKIRGIEFPGGKREAGNHVQACDRELFEETERY